MDKSKLASAQARLSVQKTKLARLSNHGEMEVETKEIEKAKSDSNRFDFIFKIVIIGDAVRYNAKNSHFIIPTIPQTCGKTSLMKRYVDDQFHCQSLTTIGVDFNLKTIVVDGATIKLQIWLFSPLGGLYYHGAHAVVIAYDVTRRSTFDNIETWNDKFDDRDTEGDTAHVYTNLSVGVLCAGIDTVKVLVGCKSDLDDQRQAGQGQKTAQKEKFIFLDKSRFCKD